MSERQLELQNWLISHIDRFPASLAKEASRRFGVTRQTVNRELQRLVSDGILLAEGSTRARRYRLAVIAEGLDVFERANLEDDRPWRELVAPKLEGVPENVRRICQYGTSEMVNNAIDHSGSEKVVVSIQCTAAKITIMVTDHGIGVFRKVREACGLEDERHAILQLAKGKLTTDAERHSGQGIFFTSRMFDAFVLRSGNLALVCRNGGKDWLIDTRELGQTPHRGTLVEMEIGPRSERTSRAVFDEFTTGTDAPGFSRTRVPITLARQEGDQLISRSQARRILMGVEKFAEVVFDFDGVTTVGQAFADEMFRVWPRANPGVDISTVQVSDDVARMIAHVLGDAAAAAGEQSLRDEMTSIQEEAEGLLLQLRHSDDGPLLMGSDGIRATPAAQNLERRAQAAWNANPELFKRVVRARV